MSAAASWVYQAPFRPESHPDQLYYRASGSWAMDVECSPTQMPELRLLRFAGQTSSQITVRTEHSEVNLHLNCETMLALRNALSDALQDIESEHAERERIESFERIQEELRDADEQGGTYVYYGHPDVHYVAPDQVAAKAAELDAAGAKRYIVLPDPSIVDDRMAEEVVPA